MKQQVQARIMINEISCFGYHGVLPEERRLGQEFLVSLVLAVERPAAAGDRLVDTVDYRIAVEIARRIIGGKPRLLLETLAEEIACELLALPPVKTVTVRLAKPHPPLPGVRGGTAVEIYRSGSS